MLRELKFSSVTAHGCAVTVPGRGEGPDSSAQLRGCSQPSQVGLSSLSRPRWG